MALPKDIADFAALNLAELRALWESAFKAPVPKLLSRDLMLRGLAYEIQAKAEGGLTFRHRRRLVRVLEDGGTPGRVPRSTKLAPGTRLLRDWHGETHEVTVLDGGYAHRGCAYRSLSRIARVITGARWSGPRFFQVQGDG